MFLLFKKSTDQWQLASFFASQSETLDFTEEENRRFKAENVQLHQHFQENLEDAK